MSGLRIAYRFARERSSAPCGRCLTIVAVAPGDWYAAEPDDLGRPICDRCAERDDAGGFAMVCGFRRAARPTWRTAA